MDLSSFRVIPDPALPAMDRVLSGISKVMAMAMAMAMAMEMEIFIVMVILMVIAIAMVMGGFMVMVMLMVMVIPDSTLPALDRVLSGTSQK